MTASSLCLVLLSALFAGCLPALAQTTAPEPPPTTTSPDSPPPLPPGIPASPPESTSPGQPAPVIAPRGPAVATSIGFVGNTVIAEEDLLRASGIQPGQTFTAEELNRAVQSIQAEYHQRGYTAVVLDVTAPAPGTSGPMIFRLAELTITAIRLEGLMQVSDQAVRRMLEVQAGQIYNRDAVTRDLIRLQQLGVFERVSVELEPTGESSAALVWTLQERTQLNYAELGGSYAPQTGLEGFGRVTFGNLFHRAERLTVTGTANSIAGAPGGEVTYFWPWIGPRNTAAELSVYSMPRFPISGDISGEDDPYYERHSGFHGAVRRELHPNLIGEAGLRFETVSVHNLPESLFSDPASQGGHIAVASVQGTWDRRNSALDPTRGTLGIAFLEGGVAKVGSATGGIGKAWGDRRWYIPLRTPRAQENPLVEQPVPTLAIRTMLGGIAGQTPFYEQFFVGGIGNLPLRGYREGRFWGKYAFLTNVELRWPLFRSVSGVVFADAGDAWGSPYTFKPGTSSGGFSQHEDFSPRIGVGFGIRVGTGFGPVRLDFAQGDAFRVHFSVGQTF